MDKTVRTRIAPSPTGFPHLGTIYQVLFDYAYAHKHGGQFVVRVEDTDRKRYVEGAEEVVSRSFHWFGLDGDEDPWKGGPYGPYRQSERLDIYKPYIEDLLKKGRAYYCFCSKERLEEMRRQQDANHQPPMYDRHCRDLPEREVRDRLADGVPHVVRLRVPDGEIISFDDLLAGHIEFRSELIDDQVLLKEDGYPTYHMAVVVDDHLMEISHIFRGKEWISSTPKHVLLYRFLEWEMPEHIHLPLILNSEGQGKLSKRHGHSSVDYYRNLGYLPEAVLNYMTNIVWKHPENKEIYSFVEFMQLFEIKDVTSQGPRFDLKKLDWVNGQWVRNIEDAELIKRLTEIDEVVEKSHSKYSAEQISSVLPLVKDRLNLLSGFDDLALFFFEDVEKVIESQEQWKTLLLGKRNDIDLTREMLMKAIDVLTISETWTHDVLESLMRGVLESEGWKIGEFFMVLRVGVTGRSATPPLFETMEVLGKDLCLDRLNKALQILS
ncbi:MAG: glutamate--tRNA ligase [bacterium]|nr:glutamate--tRNA ligase [bacterium]